MNYCSNCGKTVTYQTPPGDTHNRFICTSCDTIHYQNPRMVVGCLPVWQDKILICKRAIEPRFGLWTLPAGFMENNETVEEGAIRETREEAGAEVTIDYLHTLYSLPQVNQVYAIFLARMTSEKFHPGEESSACKLISPDEIPWDKLAFSAIRFCLKSYTENLNTSKREVTRGYLIK